jgi:glucose-6-phosphate-specific signal transduction histidine kinase
MGQYLTYAALSLFMLFAWGTCWLALWTISFWLLGSDMHAALLLPGGVGLALLILLPRHFWPVLLLTPLALSGWLHRHGLITQPGTLFAPLLWLPVALAAQRYWQRFDLYWQRLSLLLAAAFICALLAIALNLGQPVPTFLASLTGGAIMAPFAWLVWDALYRQHRVSQQLPGQTSPPLRTSLLLWCSLFFAAGAGALLTLAPQMERLLLILVFLPNVVMAWRFGWQGGVLAALIGSLVITLARQFGVGFASLTEMELYLTTQALLGMGVGIAVSPSAAFNFPFAALSPAAGNRTARQTPANGAAGTYGRGDAQNTGTRTARRNWSKYHGHTDSVPAGGPLYGYSRRATGGGVD